MPVLFANNATAHAEASEAIVYVGPAAGVVWLSGLRARLRAPVSITPELTGMAVLEPGDLRK